MSFKDWFKEPPPKPVRHGLRHPAPQFTMVHPSGASVKEDSIKDISPTGVFLLTQERWDAGTEVPLTLHRRAGKDEAGFADFVMSAKVVRCAGDGVALTFDLPRDIHPDVWVALVEGASGEAGPDDLIGHFKMARAVAFWNRICPNAEKDFRRRICSDLSSGRFKQAVEVALKAERIVDAWPDADSLSADPRLLAAILEYGSWANEDSIQQDWAGLMALACAGEMNTEAFMELVERVSQFAPIHYKIFATACDRATKVWADGKLTARPLIYTTDEVLNLGASKDLGRMERELQHLFTLGFFISDNVPSSYLPKDELNLAPTPLGLELYTRFHAHRGSPEEYYGLGSRTSARAMAMPSLARV